MKNIVYLIFSVVTYFSTATFAAGYSSKNCEATTLAQKNLDLLQATCQSIKDSKECKDLYSRFDKDSKTPEEANSKKLKCDRATIENQKKVSFLGELALACGASLTVDPIVDFGTFLGESAAQGVISWDKARDCDKNFQQKAQLIQSFNFDMPELLQIPTPSRQKIESMSCAQIHILILNHKQTQTNALSKKIGNKAISPSGKSQLTSAEKEFLNYDHKRLLGTASPTGASFGAKVETIFKEVIAKDQCYSPEQSAKLRCEIAATVASIAVPGLFAIRAARLAKLSGLKVEEVLLKIQNADRATAGVGGRILNDGQKSEILALSSELSNNERVTLFEKMFNRSLTPSEKEQLIKMHDVGSSEGRGFTELTKADKDLKIKLAQTINPETGKPFFSTEEMNALMRNGITGIHGKEGQRLSSSQLLRDGFYIGNKEKIKAGFEEGNKYYSNYFDLSESDFKKALGGPMNEFDQNAGHFLTQAATGGLKPNEVVEMAGKISNIDGGPLADNLIGMSARLGQESDRLATLRSASKMDPARAEFQQYIILESRLQLEQKAANAKYANKYKELDYDKFETMDPVGYARLQDLSQKVFDARNSADKKRWPYQYQK